MVTGLIVGSYSAIRGDDEAVLRSARERGERITLAMFNVVYLTNSTGFPYLISSL